MENRIRVELLNGRQIVYTKEVLQLMLDDPYVAEITDMGTGEVLKWIELDGEGDRYGEVHISLNISDYLNT